MKSNNLNVNNSNSYSNGFSKLKEFIKKLVEYLKENKLFIVFFVIAIVLVGISYLYSENYRINKKTNDVLNTLVYSEPREMIDFCGVDNRTADRMYTGVIFNKKENTIKVLNPNINLFDLGITSEYIFYIKGTGADDFFNEGFFHVEKVLSKNTVKFDETRKIRLSNEDKDITEESPTKPNFDNYEITREEENIEITFYRPNSKINPYKFRKLTDYYVSSSHQSALIGHQKADYCSIDMINRVIFLGARYIELDIFNKEIKNDTIPMVSSGYSKGNIKFTLNSIELKDCLDLISQMAFSESHINNYNDPFFIFLNLKVDGNVNTLNKVAELIKSKLGNRLLSKKYLNTNIGNASLCELKKRTVILSSGGWKGSDLEDVVNSSTDSPYLQRLTLNEVINYKERAKPKATIRKNTIQIIKGSPNAIIKFLDNDVDLTKMGITNTDNIVIEGAKRVENNSGNFLFKIDNFSSNSIMLDKKVNLVSEDPENMISIHFYDKSYSGEHITLEEYNKRNLTICVPDDRLLSNNYNYKDPMYRGCQFVAMNYQSLDDHMKAYFKLFMKRAFQFKSASLIHDVDLPKNYGLGAIVPKEKISINYDVDYSFINEYVNKTIIISAGQFPDLSLGIEQIYKKSKHPPAKMVLDGNMNEVELLVTRGLDGRDDTVSFMLIDHNGSNTKKYLRYYDGCCYLSFESILSDQDTNYDQFKEKEQEKKMAFLPLKSLNRDSRFNSFGIIMNKPNGEVIYYLKHNKQFSPKHKLFPKFTNSYKFKMFLIDKPLDRIKTEDNFVAVLRPFISLNNKFLSLGDVIVPLKELRYFGKDSGNFDIDKILIDMHQPEINTMVVNGAVSHPIDYELIFDNRYFNIASKKIHYETNAQLSIWKPIPRDGYTAMGYLFQNGYSKPKLDEIYCVSNDYILETTFDKDFYEIIFDHQNSSINIWKNTIGKENNYGLNYYATVKNVRNEIDGEDTTDNNDGKTPPNPFDFPQNTINLTFNEFKDRIYIDNVIEKTARDEKSCNFKVKLSSEKFEIKANEKYDHLLKIDSIESKLVSTQKSEGGDNICIGLPQSYWSSYYKEVNSDDEKLFNYSDSAYNSKLQGMSCGEKSNFGTNLRMYSDNSIRLANNNKYCVTHQKNTDGTVNKDINSDLNFLYLSACRPNLNNQLFTIENQRLKVIPDGGEDYNACVTLTPDKDIRLEECGDQKFTALYLWDNNIIRDDKCIKNQANDSLKNIGAIEKCIDNSFYVIYLQGIFKFKEFCTKQEALAEYNSLYKNRSMKGIAGIILTRKNKVLNSTMTPVPPPFLNEMNNVSSKQGSCFTCEFPSRMLCSKQRMEASIYNSFNNFEEEQRLNKHCMKMKDNTDLRCGRSSRQKFLNFPTPEDFCLNIGKMVYVQFPEILESNEKYFDNNRSNIEEMFKRTTNRKKQNQLPVENLLDEYYNNTNYTVFIMALLKTGSSPNKFKLLFQTGGMTNDLRKNFTSIEIFKNSSYICPEYRAKESMIKVGSKVLVKFDDFYVDGDGIKRDSRKISKDTIKYFGVVIKKMSSKIFRVMLSINSYESNHKKNIKVGVKYYTSNPIKDYSIEELTLFKQADVCL
jgi:hypothetical protein